MMRIEAARRIFPRHPLAAEVASGGPSADSGRL
jgi:hypothetical protein